MKENFNRIKSYVLRQGRLTKGQKKAFKNLWPIYGLDSLDSSDAIVATDFLDFTEVFGNNSPVILEVGFGNGESLLELAQKKISFNFIGIEVYSPGVGHALIGAHKLDLQNIKFFCKDALDVMKFLIPDKSLSQVNLFFPDPWKKRRHHKRRILRSEFVDFVCTKLKSDGSFHFASDWQHYAQEALALSDREKRLVNLAGEGNYSLRGDRPVTKFEIRGLKKGHKVWDVIHSLC